MQELSNELDKFKQSLATNNESLQKFEKQSNKISIYTDNLSEHGMFEGLSKLKAAFPKMSDAFFNLLPEAIKRNKLTDSRLNDAVNNLIDNFVYDSPKIADIIKFNQYVETHTYMELVEMVNKYGVDMKKYTMLEKNGRKVWALRSQLEKYNLI